MHKVDRKNTLHIFNLQLKITEPRGRERKDYDVWEKSRYNVFTELEKKLGRINKHLFDIHYRRHPIVSFLLEYNY